MSKVTDKIIRACELIETHGPCNHRDITELLGVSMDYAHMVLRAGVHYGLLKCAIGTQARGFGAINEYTVAKDWRDNVEAIQGMTIRKIRGLRPNKSARALFAGVNSVFALGAA